jgi:hypothetical protein
MDVLRLRTLTRKSIMPYFGPKPNYAQDTIARMLKCNPHKLICIYFTKSKISFTEDILQELGIKERIQKPGKDWDIFLAKYKKPLNTIKASAQKQTSFWHAKDKHLFSKANMQSRNHGKNA